MRDYESKISGYESKISSLQSELDRLNALLRDRDNELDRYRRDIDDWKLKFGTLESDFN